MLAYADFYLLGFVPPNRLAGTSYSVIVVGARVHVDRDTTVRSPHPRPQELGVRDSATPGRHRNTRCTPGRPSWGELLFLSSRDAGYILWPVRVSTVTVQTNIPSVSVHPISTPAMPAPSCCTLAGEEQLSPAEPLPAWGVNIRRPGVQLRSRPGRS